MQTNVNRAKYATLERELGEIRSKYSYEYLKGQVIRSNYEATESNKPKLHAYMNKKEHLILRKYKTIIGNKPNYVAVGNALGLSRNAITELREFYLTVIEPIKACLGKMEGVNSGLAMLRDQKWLGVPQEALDDNRERLESARDSLAKELVALVEKRLGEDGLDSASNIRVVIAYPLLISQFDTWMTIDAESGFAGRLINTIKDTERDKELRAVIANINIPTISLRV